MSAVMAWGWVLLVVAMVVGSVWLEDVAPHNPAPSSTRSFPGQLVAVACFGFGMWSFFIQADLQGYLAVFGAGLLGHLVNAATNWVSPWLRSGARRLDSVD